MLVRHHWEADVGGEEPIWVAVGLYNGDWGGVSGVGGEVGLDTLSGRHPVPVHLQPTPHDLKQ